MRRATVTCHPVTLLAVGSSDIVGMVNTWNQSGHLESEWKLQTKWQTPGIGMEATNRLAVTWNESGHLELKWNKNWAPGFGAEAADKKGLKIIQSYSVLHPLLHLHELHFLQMSVY